MGGFWPALRSRDPHGYTLRRGLRAAVVVPVDFAIGSQLIGNAQVATFAAFGSFALLMFTNFPGGRLERAGAYAVLAVAGVALISLGTVLATPDWLAVVAMAVVAFGLLFAGVVSSVINGGTQAALLTFILAVMLPGVRTDLPQRLAGWGIACAVSIPVALLVWPPGDENALRARAGGLARALAGMLHLEPPASGQGDPRVAMSRAVGELRAAFRTSAARSAALSTGARLLIRLVDELDWLSTAVVNACGDAPSGWPQEGLRLRDAAARVLRAAAVTLDHDGTGPAQQDGIDLATCISALDDARRAVADEALVLLRARPSTGNGSAVAGEFDRPLYAAHELGYAVRLVAGTVSAIAAADSRSWWARLTGRRLDVDELGLVTVAQRAAMSHFDRHSVWLHNSIRGAVGLAVAVLLSRVVDAQNAFWIGLGALSVLRSNALSTGSTVARALAGTVLGFAIGGVLVAIIGTNHAVLWTLLPLVILVAAAAPAVISFVAGQAAFTVFTIILFNIIAPAGWRIGVVRVEDVALGCGASLIAGLLFWPRGAAAVLGAAYAEAYRTSADFLRDSVARLTGLGVEPLATAGSVATAAGSRLDDALRQYLAEQGAKHVPLESVTALANGATRLRLAGAAITQLNGGRDGAAAERGDGLLRAPVELLSRRADTITRWYSEFADVFDGSHPVLPTVEVIDADESFLDVVLPGVDDSGGDARRAALAEQVLWSGQYLGDVNQLRGDLLAPAEQVSDARARSWWRR